MSPGKTLLLFAVLLTSLCLAGRPAVYGNRTHINITGDPIHRADTLPIQCPKTPEIEKIITEAISLGAPIYNEGLHLACYRIYEWAGYKILYEYGKSCKEVERILKTAIEKSHGDFSDTEKAWIMRAAFDKIMGVPTQMGAPEKSSPPSRQG